MTESKQHQTTKSGQKTDEKSNCDRPEPPVSSSPERVMPIASFGLWDQIGPVVQHGKHRKVLVKCRGCGVEKLTFYDNLKSGKSNGCRRCSSVKRTTPTWLRSRVSCMRQRCENPRHPSWGHYGGRGVEFRFSSTAEGALWIMENLGLQQDMEIDRIDNNGHYEPGNLRWATRRTNIMNRTNTVLDETFEFVQKDWPFTKGVVMKKLREGMTREEVLQEAQEYVAARRNWWPEVAEKFESMTSSMLDPDGASQQTDD